MRIIGLDIGSRTVKRVTVEDGEYVEHLVLPNNHDPLSVCDELLSGYHPDKVVATGYGRHLFASHRKAEILTEIRAVAIGARHEQSQARTLLDIGGQDTKVVSLNADGGVVKFEMNDRCAAGTGRFLEVMATALSFSMDEFVQAARSADSVQSINSMCTVFAESEVISAVARGVQRGELSRGLHEAVARRAVAMLRRLTVRDDVVFCGGGALNVCLRELISERLGHELVVSPHPQIVAALGAAVSCS